MTIDRWKEELRNNGFMSNISILRDLYKCCAECEAFHQNECVHDNCIILKAIYELEEVINE